MKVNTLEKEDFILGLKEEITQHIEVFNQLENVISHSMTQVIEICGNSLQNGGKLLLFGNGGSAADAQHIATELTVRYKVDRQAIAAIALTTDTSAITACGNDLGFEYIFSRQIEALGRAGDVAIGISTSGNSP